MRRANVQCQVLVPCLQSRGCMEGIERSSGACAGARLIGVEYIISERLFKALPEEEKRFWHSHR